MGLFDYFFGPPSRDRFAKLFMTAMRKAGDTRTMRYDSEEFRIAYSDGEKDSGYSNLVNIYAEYVKVEKSERPKCLSAFVRASLSHLKEMPEEFDDAKPDLRPRLWLRSTMEAMRLESLAKGDKEFDMPHTPLGEHLILALAYDLPEAVRSIGGDDLAKWNVTFYEAMEAAKQNLFEIDIVCGRIGDSLYGVLCGDSYDATRIIHVEFIRSLEVKGEPIVMVTNRDQLLITGSDDDAGLEIMADLAEKTLENEPRPLSAIPLRLEGDDWVEWSIPAEHRLSARFRLMELKFFYAEYEEQKRLLEALHQSTGEDVFVASFSAIQKDDAVFSYCIWPKNVDTLLPRTDRIVLMRTPEDPPLFAAWESVQAAAGDLMELTEDYPPRYRVSEFPSEEVLSRIERLPM